MNRRECRLKPAETAACAAAFILISSALSWLFYDSAIPVFIMLPLFIPFERFVKEMKIRKRKEKMSEEFIGALVSVSASLSAGVSAENAFSQSIPDMEKLYGKDSVIVPELKIIDSKVSAGQRLTDALADLAKRWRIREINDFSLVFSAAVRNGGDLPAVISSCTQIMEKKQQIETEAKILIRGKQYEQRVMCVIPPGILTYLRLSSGSFIKSLYHNAFGISVMTVCLAVYVSALIISEKIGDIRV